MTTRKYSFSDYCDSNYEVIETDSWKWGTEDTVVIHEDDGTHWMACIAYHVTEGCRDATDWPVEAVQVHQVPVTTMKWVEI